MPPAPTGTTGGPEPAAALAEAPASALTIAQIHQLLESGGHHQLARLVHDDLRVVTLEPGTLVFAPAPALGAAVARALSDALFAATEIGRASFRERVCQYVKISVAAVSLKKKNEN